MFIEHLSMFIIFFIVFFIYVASYPTIGNLFKIGL